MARHLVRKNLMLDPEPLRKLARRRGTSESETVRQVVDFALAADEIMDALEELRRLGGIEDVFHTLPDDFNETPTPAEPTESQ